MRYAAQIEPNATHGQDEGRPPQQVAVAPEEDVREGRQRRERGEHHRGVHDQGMERKAGDLPFQGSDQGWASGDGHTPSYGGPGCSVRSRHSVGLMPISGPGSGSVDYTDDLRLAHVLADDADSITENRFKALDLHVMSKPDLTPVTDADQAVEEAIRRTLSRVRSRDAVLGEEQGSTGHSQRQWIDRPDRRHQELRPRRTGLGHADRAGRRRRGGARRGLRARAPAPLVGVEGRRRVDRPVAAQGDPLHRVRRTPPRGRLAVVLLPPRLGGARAAPGLPVADAPVLAYAGVQRLLVLHAARRGRRRHRRRARARRSTTWPRSTSSSARPAAGSPPSTAPTARTAATRWPPTATSTRPCWPSSARSPTTTTTPSSRRLGPGSVHDLRSRRPQD